MNLLRRVLKGIFGSVFLATVTFVGAPIAFSATVLAGLIFLPLPATIPLPKQAQTVQPDVVYDRYGHQIATLAQFESDLPFTEAQVPAVLKEAIISDEDHNFYHESGVDLRGTIRALVRDLQNRETLQGGSTITQQYVKLAFLTSQRTILRKVKEAILASQLAREASKDEILYHYMTLLFLGDGNTGVQSAAENYFHTSVQNLNPSQAATLAGIVPAPTARAPEQHLAAAEAARKLVIKEMYAQHYLTSAQYGYWIAQQLAFPGTVQDKKNLSTTIYPEVTKTSTSYPDFVDYVQRWLQANLPANVLDQGGLRIQTTLEPSIQQDAYAAVNASLDGSAFPTDMAMAAVEPGSGFVDALVGGRGFGQAGAPDSEVNLALGGCPTEKQDGIVANEQVPVSASCWTDGMIEGGGQGRQPGSSWKPFTLATAFTDGIQPSTVYPAPYVYQLPNCVVPAGKPASVCQIHNDEGDLGGAGTETLATATAQSTNTVYAQLAEQVGCPNVATTAKKMGIETAYYANPPFYFCQSYALGELGVSPLDMASAYGVFANHGQRVAQTPILEIVNAQGKVVVDNIHHHAATTTALSAAVADNVTNVLQGVLNGGTATGRGIGRPAAGKTGTTTNNTDAWFVGYTPTLSAAFWMGNAEKDSVPVGQSANCPRGCVTGHFENGAETTYYGVYGADWPAIAWQEFMEAALNGVPATPFSAPTPLVTPQEAAALEAPRSTTTVAIEPGYAGQVQQTPVGGPYVYPASSPVASPPTTTAPSTTTSTTTTEPSTTTTSTTNPFNSG